MVEPLLVSKRSEIERDWDMKGHRAEVEDAQRIERELGQRSAAQAWASYTKRFDPGTPEIYFETDVNGGQYVPTSFRPADALDVPWPRFNLTREELSTLAAGAPALIRERLGGNVDAGVERLSFEYTSVAISRPWFVPDVFASRAWRFLDSGKFVSDGADPPSGICTAYVAAVVLLRNLSVTRKRSSETPIGQINFGPLALETSIADSEAWKAPAASSTLLPLPPGEVDRPMLSFLEKVDFSRIQLDLPPRIEALSTSPLEELLGQLLDRVQVRLGRSPLEQFQADLVVGRGNTALSHDIESAVRDEDLFARDVAALITQLDRRGGREIASQAYPTTADPVAVTVGTSAREITDEYDLSKAPKWTKVGLVLGPALCLLGMLIFGVTVFQDMNTDLGDPNLGQVPRGIPLAFAVFFVGFVTIGVSGFGHALAKKRPRNAVTVDVTAAVAYVATYLLREISPIRELLQASVRPDEETTTMPPESIYVLGFICKRLPRSPNPDPDLSWPSESEEGKPPS